MYGDRCQRPQLRRRRRIDFDSRDTFIRTSKTGLTMPPTPQCGRSRIAYLNLAGHTYKTSVELINVTSPFGHTQRAENMDSFSREFVAYLRLR